MYQVIIVIQVLLGIGIIALVLMQQGRGADAGAAFGSGASGSVFGAQGSASFLSRTTAVFAALFFSSSLGLAFLSGHTTQAVDLMGDSTQVEKNVDVPVVETLAPATDQIPNVTESVPVPKPESAVESAKPAATVAPSNDVPEVAAKKAEPKK